MSSKENEQENLSLTMTNHRHLPNDTSPPTCQKPAATTAISSNTVVVSSTITTATTRKRSSVFQPGYRDNWSNRIVYLLSIIGFVVDLGKVFS